MRAPTMYREHARKNCRVRHPAAFRGSSCGLRENFCSRTIVRFYWPVRSREGEGSMERDNPVECNGQEMPLLGMHAAEPQGGPGAAAPGAFWGLFRGEKSPAGGSTSRDAGLFTAPGRNFPAAQSMSCSGKASFRRMPHILSM